jgi:hypothetical protein
VLHGDDDEAVLRWLVGWEKVAEHPLHRLHRLGQEQLGPRPAVALPPSPRFTPSRRLRRLTLHRSGEREREREREGRQEPGCPVRWRPLARLPGVTLVSSLTAFRSGENGNLRERKRERERMEEREIENGWERTTREGKRILLQGPRAALCNEKAHDPCVTFGRS